VSGACTGENHRKEKAPRRVRCGRNDESNKLQVKEAGS